MKNFNAGTMRPATEATRLSAANDLVRRTLAQHGLQTPRNQMGRVVPPSMPALGEMLQRFRAPGHSPAADIADLPKGATFRQETFTCSAGRRSFRTYVPASAATGATGVVVMLHGCTQNPEDFATGTGMNALAEKQRFIAVYPAQSRGSNAQSCWNWFSPGDQRRGRGEPAILSGLTTQVCTEFGIGRDRTFVAGLSAGAAMAVILGETYGDVFAAVGAHSGLPMGSANDVASALAAMANGGPAMPLPAVCDHKVRTIVFHGTGDTTVHPSNGDAIARRARQINAPQSIENTVASATAGRSYIRDISSDPTGSGVIEYWRIDDLGHAWSGGRPNGSYTDTQGPDASAEMIRFFFETSDKDL